MTASGSAWRQEATRAVLADADAVEVLTDRLAGAEAWIDVVLSRSLPVVLAEAEKRIDLQREADHRVRVGEDEAGHERCASGCHAAGAYVGWTDAAAVVADLRREVEQA